jgi:ribosomal protein L31E
METHLHRRTVAGVFKDEEAAAQAVKKLVEEHFDPDTDVRVIASHHQDREDVPVAATFDVGRTSLIGAVVGAALAAAGVAIAGLTSGPFTMESAGPVWAALEAAYAGGATGFAIGALMSMDFAKAGAKFRSAHVHGGVVWVGVLAAGERAERAVDILREAGAKHFMDKLPEPVRA